MSAKRVAIAEKHFEIYFFRNLFWAAIISMELTIKAKTTQFCEPMRAQCSVYSDRPVVTVLISGVRICLIQRLKVQEALPLLALSEKNKINININVSFSTNISML